MLLQEALDLLQKGEVLCRMQHVWKIVLHPSPNAGNYIFSLADLLADDWKLFELPSEDKESEVDLEHAA